MCGSSSVVICTEWAIEIAICVKCSRKKKEAEEKKKRKSNGTDWCAESAYDGMGIQTNS